MTNASPLTAIAVMLALVSCSSQKAAEDKPKEALPTIETLQVLSAKICQCKLAGHKVDALENEFTRRSVTLNLDMMHASVDRQPLGMAGSSALPNKLRGSKPRLPGR